MNSLRAYFWPVAFAAVIFAASGRATVASPDVTNIDKVAHFSVYGLLATLVSRLRPGATGAVLGLLAASAFGASDEWHQSFVPGRAPGWDDWIADTAGAALAVLLYLKWTWYRDLLERPVWRRKSGPEQ